MIQDIKVEWYDLIPIIGIWTLGFKILTNVGK